MLLKIEMCQRISLKKINLKLYMMIKLINDFLFFINKLKIKKIRKLLKSRTNNYENF